jgi:hypothetical protein
MTDLCDYLNRLAERGGLQSEGSQREAAGSARGASSSNGEGELGSLSAQIRDLADRLLAGGLGPSSARGTAQAGASQVQPLKVDELRTLKPYLQDLGQRLLNELPPPLG